jgi:hypoxanthine phosphoribosyltransferase
VDTKKLTHDRMLHPWFAEMDQDKRGKIKVFVVDDTFQTGRALDDCVRRLKWVYNVDEKNITVAVFAVMTDDGFNERRIVVEKKFYTVYRSSDRGKPQFTVNWGGGKFYLKKYIEAFSSFFVEALHACSEPYVGYIPAFRLTIKEV